MYELVKYDAPILREKLSDYVFSDLEAAREIAETLSKTCQAYKAVGLSANQCGLPHRVFVMNISPGYVCFNPVITAYGLENNILIEGCLSFPLLNFNVKRPASVRVRYQDEKGAFQTKMFGGLEARVFLHEFDHLEGKTFTQRASLVNVRRGIEKTNKFINKRKVKHIPIYTEAELKINSLI